MKYRELGKLKRNNKIKVIFLSIYTPSHTKRAVSTGSTLIVIENNLGRQKAQLKLIIAL